MQQLFTLKNVGKHIIGGISSIATYTATYSGLLIPTQKKKIIIGCPCTFLQVQNMEDYKEKHRGHASIYKQVPYEDFKFWPNNVSNEKLWRHKRNQWQCKSNCTNGSISDIH